MHRSRSGGVVHGVSGFEIEVFWVECATDLFDEFLSLL